MLLCQVVPSPEGRIGRAVLGGWIGFKGEGTYFLVFLFVGDFLLLKFLFFFTACPHVEMSGNMVLLLGFSLYWIDIGEEVSSWHG